MTLKIYNETKLEASLDDRIISGLLLPFGEQGYTNKGRVTASRGILKASKDVPIMLNVEHDQKRRIGKIVTMQETGRGIEASFRVVATSAGDDALLEATEGLRASLSIEIAEPVIRDGKILGGTITGGALVAEPAFPSAVLNASIPDEGELENTTDDAEETADIIEDVVDLLEEAKESVEHIADVTNLETPTPEAPEKKETAMTTLSASRQFGGLTSATPKKEEHGLDWLVANLAGQMKNRDLHAALADIVPANILGLEQPQAVGELWDGKAYERQIVPLFNHANLTSFEVEGWRWVAKPEVAPYAGDKSDVPSNEVETEALKIAAKRIAGAHDVDRKFRDFPNEEFWRAYYQAMTESYARQSDAMVLSEVKGAATKVEAGANANNFAQGIVNIVDGALSILNETDTLPTFAIVALDLWRDIILTPKDNALAYLNASLKLEEGTMTDAFKIVPSAQLSPGETLVGTKSAVTVHELAGSPIRVEALDVARGGVDTGLFGYLATNVHSAGGLALVGSATE